MAKISGSEKNNKLIEQVTKAIETIITTSKTLDNTDDDNSCTCRICKPVNWVINKSPAF